jgi:hypothetical protein
MDTIEELLGEEQPTPTLPLEAWRIETHSSEFYVDAETYKYDADTGLLTFWANKRVVALFPITTVVGAGHAEEEDEEPEEILDSYLVELRTGDFEEVECSKVVVSDSVVSFETRELGVVLMIPVDRIRSVKIA